MAASQKDSIVFSCLGIVECLRVVWTLLSRKFSHKRLWGCMWMEQSGTKGLRLQRAVNLLLTIRSACTATPFTSAFTGFNIPWKSGGMKYEYKCLSFISWGYPLERALPFLYLENQQRAPDRNSKWAGLVPCLMADLGQDQQNKSWCTATTPVWRGGQIFDLVIQKLLSNAR